MHVVRPGGVSAPGLAPGSGVVAMAQPVSARAPGCVDAECRSLLFLLTKTHVAGSRDRIARPLPRRSTAPIMAPPNTLAPMPQQPRRRRGRAAAAGLAHGLPAPGTQMTKNPTRMASSCRRPRSRRLPGEWYAPFPTQESAVTYPCVHPHLPATPSTTRPSCGLPQ